ncbi:hypothetical protein [Alkalinema sp. FACHB-956]|nr:hypothetical protein [Alkalinema sp. FACHB-956]
MMKTSDAGLIGGYLYGPGVDQVLAQQMGDRTDWFLLDKSH